MTKSRGSNSILFGPSDVLERIGDALLPGPQNSTSDKVKVFAICGLGGVGKTEIAKEFMLRHKDEFDAVFWIQADDETKLKESFSQMSIALNLEDKKDAKDQIASTNLVRNWLDNPVKDLDADTSITNSCDVEEAKWLLIYDNVDDMLDLDEFWPHFGQRGSILVTSQEPLAKINIYTTFGIDLSPFDNVDGARFLLELTQLTQRDYRDDSPIPEVVLAIIQRFGGLPLGIEQMAGIIQRKALDFSEFLEKYELEINLKELVDTSFSNFGPESTKLLRFSNAFLFLIQITSKK